MRRIALGMIFAAMAAASASAQGVTSDDIMKKLAPPAPAAVPGSRLTRSINGVPTPDPASGARTRAIQILEAGTAPIAPSASPSAPPTVVVVKPELLEEFKQVKAALPKIDLKINFEYDSDRPTPEGMQQLHQLGLALLKIQAGKFVLIGHTDARGADAYNDSLSRRRALAVVAILASHYRIPPARLVATGMGERQLIGGLPPEHEANRRVEVVNLGQ